MRIEPGNVRALRGMEWLEFRQKDIDDARAAAERVKPYWQTSKPKPLLNLIKKRNEGAATASGETHTANRAVPELDLRRSLFYRPHAPPAPTCLPCLFPRLPSNA